LTVEPLAGVSAFHAALAKMALRGNAVLTRVSTEA